MHQQTTPDLPGTTGTDAEAESLAELRGDCAAMAAHWSATVAPVPDRVSPSRIHGVTVPPKSARLVDGMSDYGD